MGWRIVNRAIITRHVRGGRPAICARMGSDLSTVTEYPEGLDQKERHAYAAFRFCQQFDCFGVYVGAMIPGGVVWVPVPDEVDFFVSSGIRKAWFYHAEPGSRFASTSWPV